MRKLAPALRAPSKSLPLALFISLVALAFAPAANAQFGVDPEDWIAQVYGSNVDGHGIEDTATDQYGVDGIYDQAGGHPWKGITDFTMRRTDAPGDPDGGNASFIRVDVPAGLVPNPTIFPRCPRAIFDEDPSLCPTDSQIGMEELTIKEEETVVRVQVPLYNVGIEPDEVSLFGFHPADAAPLVPVIGSAVLGLEPVEIVGGVRDEATPRPDGGFFGPHDTGLFFTIESPETPAVLRSKLTFWGVPGDPAHNAQRDQACATIVDPNTLEPTLPPACSAGNVPSTVPDIPFLTNPMHCDNQPRITRLSLWSYLGAFAQVEDPTPTIDGKDGPQHCERVPFDASIDVTPDTTEPDAPVGPAVTLTTPQEGLEDKDVIATSHVRGVTVTLPPGMTINPSAANGLEACSDAQLAANTGVVGGDECPEGSKVGTVDVKSPLLPDSVTGFAFVGQPLPGDTYRLFVTLEGRGVSIRLKGSITPDPITGQLTATFPDNPQQPFETFTVDFEDGPRAPLANPLDCGAKTASGIFTPWSGTAPVTATDGFTIGEGDCPTPFDPGFSAATANPRAGAVAPFTATLVRPDRNQYLSSARVVTPPGLAGMISQVGECSNAQAAAGTCPADSRIGTATTTAGAGSEPFRLSGPVYLTEGYKGAPFGMVVVIRAIAGPYDLGTVIVRQSIFVDPEDAHITVVSDPFPRILDGVPIRLRQVDVALDTPGFAFNPTSCGAKEVKATLYPTEGAAVDRSSSFTLGACEALGFTPKMKMQLVGPRQTRFEGHPALHTTVEAPKGQANIGKVRVALPPALALDPKNSQKVCSVADAAKADCPTNTRIGFAKAISPALDGPLQGPVYFVQGIRTDPTTGNQIRTLPSLLAKLRGEIAINLRGTTAVEGRRLVSNFDRVPDAPISDFRLNLRGGKTGPLVVSARRGICDRKQVTLTAFTGQNAKTAAQKVNMRKPCRRPLVVFRKIRASASKLVVKGTIRPKATKRLRVSMRCGKTRITKTANRPRKGRWAASIKRKGACAAARKATLKVSYPGGGDFRIAVRKRNLKLPAGS